MGQLLVRGRPRHKGGDGGGRRIICQFQQRSASFGRACRGRRCLGCRRWRSRGKVLFGERLLQRIAGASGAVGCQDWQEESETDAAAVLATGIALTQAQDRYRAGIVTYLEVSTAETAALQAQVQATTIQARRMSASILLIKALGGGWDQASLAKQ